MSSPVPFNKHLVTGYCAENSFQVHVHYQLHKSIHKQINLLYSYIRQQAISLKFTELLPIQHPITIIAMNSKTHIWRSYYGGGAASFLCDHCKHTLSCTMFFSLLLSAALCTHGRRSIALKIPQKWATWMGMGANEFCFFSVVQHMPTGAGSGGKGRPFSPDKNVCLSYNLLFYLLRLYRSSAEANSSELLQDNSLLSKCMTPTWNVCEKEKHDVMQEHLLLTWQLFGRKHLAAGCLASEQRCSDFLIVGTSVILLVLWKYKYVY